MLEKINSTLRNNNINSLQKAKDKRQKTKDINIPFVTKEMAIQCDLALADYEDLIDPKYKNWFCKAYYELGDDQIRKLAKEARTEAQKSSKNMFGWSIKKELIKRGR